MRFRLTLQNMPYRRISRRRKKLIKKLLLQVDFLNTALLTNVPTFQILRVGP